MPMSKGSRTNSTLAPERYSATKPLARFSSAPEICPLHFTVEWAPVRHAPDFHKLDETIRGHVSCSFLALVLKKELEDRIATLGHASSWPNVLADLNSLTETEVEQDGKRFLLRTPPRPAASLALRAAGVALPPTVRQLADA